VRVTAEGRLLLCLGQEHSVDLRRVLRAYPGDQLRLQQTVRGAMASKPKAHDFNLQAQPSGCLHEPDRGVAVHSAFRQGR